MVLFDGRGTADGRESCPFDLEREAFAGAERFALGRGRGGRFDDHND